VKTIDKVYLHLSWAGTEIIVQKMAEVLPSYSSLKLDEKVPLHTSEEYRKLPQQVNVNFYDDDASFWVEQIVDKLVKCDPSVMPDDCYKLKNNCRGERFKNVPDKEEIFTKVRVLLKEKKGWSVDLEFDVEFDVIRFKIRNKFTTNHASEEVAHAVLRYSRREKAYVQLCNNGNWSLLTNDEKPGVLEGASRILLEEHRWKVKLEEKTDWWSHFKYGPGPLIKCHVL
jgi:hypothetical protein